MSAEADSELKNTSEYENAIAYQLYHSVELFYKYMLLKKGVTKKSNDLAALETEYRIQFPGERYQLEQPFDLLTFRFMTRVI